MPAQNPDASGILDLCADAHTRDRPPTCRITHTRPPHQYSPLTPQHHPRTCSRSCLRFLTPWSAGVVNAYTPPIAEVLHVRVLTLEDPPTQQLNPRPTLPQPCWSWHQPSASGAVLGQRASHHRSPPSRWPASRREDLHRFHNPSQTHTPRPHSAEDSRLLDVIHQATHTGDKDHTPTPSGVLWVLWTLLKNGISRLLSGVGSILGGRGWGFGTLTPSEVVSDCNLTWLI